MPASIAIVIVTWNCCKEVRDCLRSLANIPPEWQVWVVDNASADGTADAIREEFPEVRLIAGSENVGFARANNQVIAQTSTDYVLLLNPDTVVSPGAIETAVREMEAHPDAGIVAVQLRNTDGSLQITCSRFPTPWISFVQGSCLHRLLPRRWKGGYLLDVWWDHAESRAVDWVIGAFMLARRSAIERVGPVPEDYFMYAEDLDWCYRMWRGGYQVRYTPAAAIIHHDNRSCGQHPPTWRAERTHRGKYEFCRRNYGPAGMRFVQLMDLIGYTIRRGKYSLRRARLTEEQKRCLDWMILGQQTVWRELRRAYR